MCIPIPISTFVMFCSDEQCTNVACIWNDNLISSLSMFRVKVYTIKGFQLFQNGLILKYILLKDFKMVSKYILLKYICLLTISNALDRWTNNPPFIMIYMYIFVSLTKVDNLEKLKRIYIFSGG